MRKQDEHQKLVELIATTVADKSPDEVADLAGQLFTLDMTLKEQAKAYCNYFDLGYYTYRRLVFHRIDVFAELSDIYADRVRLNGGNYE